MALNAKTNPNYVAKRINGKFAPGWSGNPGGSLEATRRSLTEIFCSRSLPTSKSMGRPRLKRCVSNSLRPT